jgi:hypothetical protein
MTEQSQSDRLAALASRRPSAPKTAIPSEPTATVPSGPTPPVGDPPSDRSWRPKAPSTTRLATTGASLVSFAAMVVAMGPLTVDAAEDAQTEPSVEDIPDVAVTPPTQPQVVIEVIPNYVSADGTPLTADELTFSAVGTPDELAATIEPEPVPVQDQPVLTNQQSTPAAATPAPAPAAAPAPPASAPPATAPPATAPPVTAPPATAPPVTAPPTTTPPPTPPPRSDASG